MGSSRVIASIRQRMIEQGFAEIEALEIIHTEAFQKRGILVGADPFGHHAHVEILRQRRQRPHEHLIFRIGGEVLDIRAVDLDDIDMHQLQIAE